jgi:hypothetical protein
MAKAPLKAPGHRCPIEDWAFSMYAMDIEERRDRMQKAIGYLQDNPDDIEEVQWIYDLTDEEMELVLRGVS